MATYLFKLPDIGEGIAEAEIVAWHIAVGDRVEEDQQLADMMTDKATVEMESPVAGIVRKLAGEVGDQIAIGSVLVEIETAGDAPAAAPAREEKVEQPLADGAEAPTAEQEEAIPVMAVEAEPAPVPAPKAEPKPEPAAAPVAHGVRRPAPAGRSGRRASRSGRPRLATVRPSPPASAI